MDKSIGNDYCFIDGILSNKDEFSWKDFNCHFKPWGIAFGGISEHLYELFQLLIPFSVYYFNSENRNSNEEFVYLYREHFQNFFNIEVDEKQINDFDDFTNYVINSIKSNRPVILYGDMYYLFYNSMYLREHYSHIFIVKGYDINRKLFYILDNNHIDNGSSAVYKDFVIKWDDLWEVYNDKCSNINHNKIFSLSVKANMSLPTYAEAVFILKKMLCNIQNGNKKYLDKRSQYLSLIINKEDVDSFRNLILSDRIMKVYRRTILKILPLVGGECTSQMHLIINKLEELYEKIVQKGLYYISSKRDNDTGTYIELVETFFDIESRFNTLIISTLENLNVNVDQQKAKNLTGEIIVNSQSAKIVTHKNHINMILNCNEAYDTWLNRDEAVQVLNDVEGKDFSFVTEIDTDNIVGDCYHFGIIIKYKSGRKILFGNHRGIEMTIFDPWKEDFVLFSHRIIENHKYSIHVKHENSSTVFNFVDEEAKSITCLKLDNDTSIKYCGIFSKTWEKIDSNTLFHRTCINLL